MVDLAVLHSMLIEMHGGMLTLATFCILAIVAARIHLRMRRTNEKYGSSWPMDSFLGKLARYAEPTAYLAGIGGVIGLITSAIVGIYVWPLELVTTSALALNKIMFSILATELWIIFIILRSKYGEPIWKNRALATVYACVGLVGFLFMVLAGSMGAHMTGKTSVIDPIFTLFGINPLTFGAVGNDFVILFISVSLVLAVAPLAAVLYFQRRNKDKGNAKA